MSNCIGAGLDVSVGPDNLSNVHSEEDGSVSTSGRWKSERTSTTREEHQSSSVEDKSVIFIVKMFAT